MSNYFNVASVKVGLVGLPNVGKSTFFNTLTDGNANADNYPFCTIDPNIADFIIEDERIDKLSFVDNPKKIVKSKVSIFDIAGLIKGASNGEGLGNKFLAKIREVDIIFHVVRCFKNSNITHVNGIVDPINDKNIVECELQLKDIETIDNRLINIEKKVKSGDKVFIQEKEMLLKIKDHLSKGKNVRSLCFKDEETKIINNLQLLTNKPVIFICNTDCFYDEENHDMEYLKKMEICLNFKNSVKEDTIFFPIKKYSDVKNFLEEKKNLTEEEKSLLVDDFFLKEEFFYKKAIEDLSKKIYSHLGLITFFTSGSDEVHAWTIQKGLNAQDASSVIHSDFKDKFIKAEVTKLEEYCYSKEKGLPENPSIKGKDYIIQDGDVVFFRIGK